jgi:hypothetical protein
MDPDQPAHPCSLYRIHAVRLQTLLHVEKLIANSMDPDQTALMHRLVWIQAGRKPTMLVFVMTRLICIPNKLIKIHACIFLLKSASCKIIK